MFILGIHNNIYVYISKTNNLIIFIIHNSEDRSCTIPDVKLDILEIINFIPTIWVSWLIIL